MSTAKRSRQRTSLHERFLRFDGAINLRDVGGYETKDGLRVRMGKLYRSGSLAQLQDVSQLASLGVHEVWDLRSAEEVAKHPDRLPVGVLYQHRPMLNPTRRFRFRALATIILRRPERLQKMMLEGYTQLILLQNAHIIKAFFETVAEGRPMLIHCTAGKDRTGIFVALLLNILGVPCQTIIADYELSNVYYESYLKGLRADLEKLRHFRVNETHIRPLLWVEGETLMQVFAFIEANFGSVERYLHEKAGISVETIHKIRQELLQSK